MRYAKQTYYSLMWHDSVCNTVQAPTVTSIIDVKKTTTWGESGVPSEFLGAKRSAIEHLLRQLKADKPRLKRLLVWDWLQRALAQLPNA